MSNNYTITVKIEDSFRHPPGHVWLVYQAPGQTPVTVGFYPLRKNIAEFLQGTSSGVMRDDSVTYKEGEIWTEPPASSQRTFIVNPQQFASSLDYMVNKARLLNDNWIIVGDGNQCTGIARNGLLAQANDSNDIRVTVWAADNSIAGQSCYRKRKNLCPRGGKERATHTPKSIAKKVSCLRKQYAHYG